MPARYSLGGLLLGVLLLVVLWSGGSVFYQAALREAPPGRPPKDPAARHEFSPAKSLSRINKSLALSPAFAAAWLARGRLVELSRAALPAAAGERPWESDVYRAVVAAPSDTPALFRLAVSCAAGYSSLIAAPGGCDALFQNLTFRSPQYGYSQFRYASYLYTKALGDQAQKTRMAGLVCGQYGQALAKLAYTKILRGEEEDRAYYDCVNLAQNLDDILLLSPSTRRQWSLLGQGITRKNTLAWDQVWPVLAVTLHKQEASRREYEGLARGLARGGQPQHGAAVLWEYTKLHPEDQSGWLALVSYMDDNKKLLGTEALSNALQATAYQGVAQGTEGLYFLSRSCQLGQKALAGSFFRQMKAREPNNTELYAGMGRCYMIWRQYGEAIPFFRWALRLSPDSVDLHIDLGRAYAAGRNHEEAVDQYQKALRLEPGNQRAKRELRRMGIYE